MKAKSELDYKLMFEQAYAFVDIAEFTESEKYKINHRNYSHGYAGISLSALACEIFFKCLIVYNKGEYGRIHNLKELWTNYKELDKNKALYIKYWMINWSFVQKFGLLLFFPTMFPATLHGLLARP